LATDPKEPTLSAARLTVAAKRARAEAGSSVQLLIAEPIAVVGMGCRFPGGANSPAEYWQLLAEGRSGIRSVPEERWSNVRETMKPHLLVGGYLDGVDRFDPEFFGIAPREAYSIDPQQRLLLEVCWEALSDAGIAPSLLSGGDTGVFIAVYNTDYSRMQLRDGAPIDAYTGVGSAHSVAAGRISFLLNLRGPCLAIDTACSSSLVATHLACQSLRRRECGIALVGGSSLKLLPDEIRVFAEWGMLSSDGRAKTFDAAADGFAAGEGCGVVVLKRLSDAISQGDRIRAVIRGAAVNHDGRSSVLTAPNGPAQEAVIRDALSDAQIAPGDVSFIETHGTGTSLGDPIEVEALNAVYGAPVATHAAANGVCALGAVKTNLGHLEAAAGIAGLIKTVLAFEHQTIPRNLNFERLNPQIQLEAGSRLRIAAEPRPWPRGAQPRFAAISSFGLGGTNAHVVLEEAPLLPRMTEPAVSGQFPIEYCLPVSAHTWEGLRTLANRYVTLLRWPEADLARLAGAAARNRDHAEFRIAVVGSTAAEVADKLEAKAAAMAVDPTYDFEQQNKLAFVFSGQGSVWQGMLPGLVAHFPEAESVFATCERLVQETAGWSLRAAADSPVMLEDTAKSQPVLFAMQMALVRVLESWGVAPGAVTGHSVGETAAAVTAGALSLEQGLRLVLKRGERMGAARAAGQEDGRMLAAEMSLAEGSELLTEVSSQVRDLQIRDAEIAAVNAPRSIVFSGPESAMRSIAEELSRRQVSTRRLDVQYAFHSAAMETAAKTLEADLRGAALTGKQPSIPLVSTVTGKVWGPTDGNAAYWGRGIRKPVVFRLAVDQLFHLGCGTFLEIGPHPVLLRSVTGCAAERIGVTGTAGAADSKVITIASMRRGQTARATLMTAAAALYESGVSLKWERIYPGPRMHMELPPYPWNRQRYWLAQTGSTQVAALSPGASGELPGQEISSPFVEGRLWETSLSTETQPWLAEHCWQEQSIFPFAAWLETARRAAGAAAGNQPVILREFAVHQRLTVGAAPVALQTLVTENYELKLAARIDGSWQNSASGYWELDPDTVSDAAQILNIEEKKKQATTITAPEEIYRNLGRNGLSYGPAFRLLQSVHVGNDFALGEIHSLPDTASVPAPALHPTLLDACLQVLQAAQSAEHRNRAVLPLSVGSYRVLRNATEVCVLVEMRSASAEEAVADVSITDSLGMLVAEIRALRVRRIEIPADRSPIWRTTWQVATKEPLPQSGEVPSTWLAPAQDSGRASYMLRSLFHAGKSQGLRFDDLNTLNTGRSQGANVLLAGDAGSVISRMLQTIAQERVSPGSVKQICLLTRGAVEVRQGESVHPEQASLLGMARSFRAEYPSIAVRLFDLPYANAAAVELTFGSEEAADYLSGMAAQEAKLVAQWLASWSTDSATASDEAVLRNGRLYQPRLEAFRENAAPATECALVIQTPGLLESLRQEPSHTPDPASDEVQIAGRAHGLNFRDVLTAVGSYAGVTAPMGAECSGVVIRAGSRAGIAPGTEVVAFAPGSLRTTVNVPAAYVVPKPASMSFAEAATIPVAFLTAHYAFSRLARIQPGQTVLVHSAAGGLGQAAVQLARWCGARVLATAGSEEKRAYLHAQGIADVFDSRSEHFADDVLRATNGLGVDVVLNALSGEKIAAGFHALHRGGAFLEVGKRDIWTPEQVAQVRPDARYWAFDLGEVAGQNRPLIAAMLREMLPAFADGKLSPLPYEIYPIDEAEDAFRHMASGRHVGKLVLAQPSRPLAKEDWTAALRNCTVLITGGTGALGVATARWLIGQGARSLILVSRRGMSKGAKQLQEEFSAQDVRLVVECANVSDRDELAVVLQRARSFTSAPLRVVVHAAGEVDDRLLTDHTEETFARGMRTKVDGARLLEELTAEDTLVATIYYSSVAASLGSAGQASYAAANAFLDGLAAQRTARGLPTLSVNWGAWSEGGMVGQLSTAASTRLRRQGVEPMLSAPALAALEQAILSGESRVSIANIAWAAYREQFPAGSSARAFFDGYLPNAAAFGNKLGQAQPTPVSSGMDEIAEIRAAARTERGPRMEAFVRACARKVLGLSAGRPLPGETPLQDLGLDSLMALELRNVLAQAAGRPLSAALLFDYPGIRGLSQYLLALLMPETKEAENTGSMVKERHAAEAASFGDELDLSAMSDAEAEELLLAELDRKGRS
jgi:acyl transferase domain-containing protein